MPLTAEQRAAKAKFREAKIKALCDTEGLSKDEMMQQFALDSVSPGICMRPDCDYTTNVEPDCFNGYCEECNTQTVQSFHALMGII